MLNCSGGNGIERSVHSGRDRAFVGSSGICPLFKKIIPFCMRPLQGGLFLIVLGLVRFGFLDNMLPHPLLVGFVNGGELLNFLHLSH